MRSDRSSCGGCTALPGDLTVRRALRERARRNNEASCGERKAANHAAGHGHGLRPILGIFGAPHKRTAMPELPEVEVTRRGLAPQLAGRVISGVAVREPRLRWPIPAAVLGLSGMTVRGVGRRGKYLLVDCGDGHLILHLGMSGSLRVLPPGTPPGKHDHFDLALGDRILRLRDPRRFGAVLWTASGIEAHPLLVHLGIEPLSRALDAARLHALTRAHRVPHQAFPDGRPAHRRRRQHLCIGEPVPRRHPSLHAGATAYRSSAARASAAPSS